MYRSVAVGVFAVLLCSVKVRSAEIPEQLKPQVEKVMKMKEKWEKMKADRLAKLKNQLKTGVETDTGGLTWELDRNGIARIQKQITAIARDRSIPIVKLDYHNLSTGDIGSLDVKRLGVLSIIDDQTMLVVPVGRNDRGNPLILRGWKTTDIADGGNFGSPKCIEVIGTEQYTSVLGAVNTVFVIKPFDIDVLLPYLKATATSGRRSIMPKSKPRPPRIWRDSTGKFSVKASFAGGHISSKVKLRKEDGSVIEVDFDRLSADDQKYIRGLR